MEGIIIFALLAAGSWISAVHCKKQRKFYMEHGLELFGTVISWNKHKEDNGRYKEIYYDLEVMAENGETYKISTPNRKGRKYKAQSNITIIVPEQFKNFENIPVLDELSAKERSGTLSEEDAESLMLLRDIQKKQSEVCNSVNAKLNQYIIIKEDIKSPFEFWLSVVMGVLFSILTILVLILYIFDY